MSVKYSAAYVKGLESHNPLHQKEMLSSSPVILTTGISSKRLRSNFSNTAQDPISKMLPRCDLVDNALEKLLQIHQWLCTVYEGFDMNLRAYEG